MKKINVLILGAGRRVELVEAFKKAAQRLSISGQVMAGDCDISAPAGHFADKFFILPRISSPNYISELINICESENINLIIPTIDTDLLILSKEKQRIKEMSGADVMISDESVVAICRDKINTHNYMIKNGFMVPKLYTTEELVGEELVYPLFIKPKSGSSSIDAYKVENSEELKKYLSFIKNPMVQDFMAGDEYTVDVFTDFESNIISVTPRLRIATRSGEISKGKIVKNTKVINEVKRLVTSLKPIGHITVQLMDTAKGIEFIEINPRFGGGAPMSIRSGSDSCEYIYRILLGETLEYSENYRDNIYFLRYDQSICLNDEWEKIND